MKRLSSSWENFRKSSVVGGKILFADDGCQGFHPFCLGVKSIQLAGQILVIFPGASVTDAVAHQPGKGRQNVDGRVDAFLKKPPVQDNLTLR